MLYIPLIIAYCAGSVPFAILVSKIMRLKDPRSYGSKNAGATNMLRSGSKVAALSTLLGDGIKGLLVVMGANYWCLYFHYLKAETVDIVALAGILVVLGHIYPIFFKFKGGKGVATTLGVIVWFDPLLALLLLLTWGIIFLIARISSLSAIGAAIMLPIYAYLLMGYTAYFGACLLIAFMVLYKHKSNVLNLFCGREHKFVK